MFLLNILYATKGRSIVFNSVMITITIKKKFMENKNRDEKKTKEKIGTGEAGKGKLIMWKMHISKKLWVGWLKSCHSWMTGLFLLVALGLRRIDRVNFVSKKQVEQVSHFVIELLKISRTAGANESSTKSANSASC